MSAVSEAAGADASTIRAALKSAPSRNPTTAELLSQYYGMVRDMGSEAEEVKEFATLQCQNELFKKLSECALILGCEARRQACGNDGVRAHNHVELARLLIKHGRSSAEVAEFVGQNRQFQVRPRWMSLVHSFAEAGEIHRLREQIGL